MNTIHEADRRVHPVWARVLAVFWVAMSLSIVAVAISSDLIGRPLWWADEDRWSTPMLYVLGATLVSPSVLSIAFCLTRNRWVQWGAWSVGVELGVLALLDRHDSPGSAVVLAALAVAAALAGVATLSARVRN